MTWAIIKVRYKTFSVFNIILKRKHVVGKGSKQEREVREYEMKLERMKLEILGRRWKVQLKLESDC